MPRERVGAALAEHGAGHRESTDDEDRADGQTRPLVVRPDQQRPGQHVPDQLRARDVAVRSQLVFEIQKLIAISFPDPAWIELEQRARRPRAHAGVIPIRARPTRMIFSSRRS